MLSLVHHIGKLAGICMLFCILSACQWQEAKQVITMADNLDQTQHVIYDDTAALGEVIE